MYYMVKDFAQVGFCFLLQCLSVFVRDQVTCDIRVKSAYASY